MSFLTATNGQTIPANFDAAIRSAFSCKQDFIIDDGLNEFEMTYSATSLEVTVKSGIGIIGGISIMSSVENKITLPANSTIWLCLRIDRGALEGQEGFLYANVSADIKQDTIFNGTGQRDMLLANITTDSNGVTALVDKRVIVNAISGVGFEHYEVLAIYGISVGETSTEKFDSLITSVSSSDTSKVTAIYMANTITITAVATGSANVTVNWGTSSTRVIPVTVS